MGIEIPLDKLPNVDKKRVLSYIHTVSWIKTIFYYMIDWRTRKQVNLLKWLRNSMALPGDLLIKTQHISLIEGNKAKILAILDFVHRSIDYKSDKVVWDVEEKWQTPSETWELKTGDCVANYEEIYTDLGIKKISELKIGDVVLSYDFENKHTCFREITKIWEKGILPIKRVYLRNGQHIDITENHPLWVRINQQGQSKYQKKYLNEIDLSRWWKRKLPIAKKIPYRIYDTPWLNEDLCYVLGHFIAEGWFSKGKVGSSGYDLIESILPLLEKNNIPFTEGKNGTNVPMINFLKSPFKEYLKTLKTDSFNIHLPEAIFHLPENKLKKMLEGMYLGDGHNGNYPDKRGYNSNKEKCYSTSSEQLARDIQRIGLQLGESYHIWKQENHKGKGNKPIWRITYNPQSHFLKDFGYKDASEVSISYIEDLGHTHMRDFEVAGTHTFIFKNGLISHQCEDGALLIYALANMYGIPDYQLYVVAGDVIGGGHCYVVYVSEDDALEYPIDWCYWYSKSYYMIQPYKERYEYYDGNQEWFRLNFSGAYKLWKK